MWSAGTAESWLELQAVADAQRKTHPHPSLTVGSLRRSAPLKNCQKIVGQVSATVVLDARRVFGTLARSDSSCRTLKDNRSGFEALVLKRSLVWTRCGSRWTLPAAQLADCMTRQSEDALRPFELLRRAQKCHDVLITGLQRWLKNPYHRELDSSRCQAQWKKEVGEWGPFDRNEFVPDFEFCSSGAVPKPSNF